MGLFSVSELLRDEMLRAATVCKAVRRVVIERDSTVCEEG